MKDFVLLFRAREGSFLGRSANFPNLVVSMEIYLAAPLIFCEKRKSEGMLRTAIATSSQF